MSRFNKISPDNRIVQTNKSFIISRAGLQVLKGQLINIDTGEVEQAIGTSLLNTAVLDNLLFQSGSYIPLGQTEPVPYDDLRLDAVTIEVNQEKNIIKTPIQGRNGTVKEYISDGDYTINIRGIIQETPLKRTYPKELVKNFIEICKAQRSLVVISTFLNEYFEIQDIVIENYSLPQVEGLRNQQPFIITASSDVPIDLEELEI